MLTHSPLLLPSTSVSTSVSNSVSASSFLPIVASRNSRNAKPPRQTPKARQNPRDRDRVPFSSSSTSSSSEATTFKPLPLQEDDPSHHTSIPISNFSQLHSADDEDDDVYDEEEIQASEYEDLIEDDDAPFDDEYDDASYDDEDENGTKGKEKGVPIAIRRFDRAKIYVKAGDGGNGAMAFRREKYVPRGGPSGGDGGRGGNVYLEVDSSISSLLPFRKCVHFRAGRGGPGLGSNKNGATGKDLVVKLPAGTVVRLAGGPVLLEMVKPGQRALLLPGGQGGRGNTSFKSAQNRVPRIAEDGEEGLDMWLELELKLVADVGIVGAPNAGKSTLLSVISAARPEIGNYPFTTLLPNLGVVSLDFDANMVVADLPGLLEGAHRGYGLGHEFLRHTERCLVLVHVVDGSGEQPEYEFDAIRLELELFDPDLAEKPFIVAFNKMDLPDAREKWASFQKHMQDRGINPSCISAATGMGTQDLVGTAYKLLKELDANKRNEDWEIPMNLNHVGDAIEAQRSSPLTEFDIVRDEESGTLRVMGAGLQRFIQMTNWKYHQSRARFHHTLDACGVNEALIKAGVKEGDTVIVGEMEMLWHNSPDKFGTSDVRKQAGSIR